MAVPMFKVLVLTKLHLQISQHIFEVAQQKHLKVPQRNSHMRNLVQIIGLDFGHVYLTKLPSFSMNKQQASLA